MRDDNPNKKFKSITVLFGILLIVSFVAYAGYNNKDKIKGWWDNLWVDDELEDVQQEPYIVGNDSNSFNAYQITEIKPTFMIIIITTVIVMMIIPWLRIFGNGGNL